MGVLGWLGNKSISIGGKMMRDHTSGIPSESKNHEAKNISGLVTLKWIIGFVSSPDISVPCR
jgi:hypothetical protein